MSTALDRLAGSGLFDPAFYALHDPARAADPDGGLAHWHGHGWREGWKPNFYFDTAWYLATHQEARAAGGDPLLHYLDGGEASGLAPCAVFDPVEYAARYALAPGARPLAHLLRHRRSGSASALPLFDGRFYLDSYPDVRAAGMDPLEHYLVQGFREDRRPFAAFDPAYYRQRHLRALPDANPLLHYLRHGRAAGVPVCMGASETSVAREVRRSTRPAASGFEPDPVPLPAGTRPSARLLAFYLPQFHPIAENDRWWGTGFTEWTTVARATPRFAGHWQPRVPRDLGHYRLEGESANATLRQQIALARGAGIAGFVFYYYSFNGRRLLEGPLERFLADPTLDMPFCLMWANENWTRRWDGSEHEVLIAQDYRAEDEPALLDDLARHLADPRYLRVGGRKPLMVYRADAIRGGPATVARWRDGLAARDGAVPTLLTTQSFGVLDPRPHGFDGAVEFPPHKLADRLPPLNPMLDLLDTDFSGRVLDYECFAAAALADPPAPFPLIRTVAPAWDNDARREGAGIVLHGATPSRYADWLARTISRAAVEPFAGERVVCINAWNEWAEGAHLEPDVHWGHGFLNATARALLAAGDHARAPTPAPDAVALLVLVGHDALAHGAQLLLLALAAAFRRSYGITPLILLGGDGPLAARFAAHGTVRIVPDLDPAGIAAALAEVGRPAAAIVNSLAAGAAVAPLRAAGIRTVLLAHEMPGLLGEKRLLATAAEALAGADGVVVAHGAVADALRAAGVLGDDVRPLVRPQGRYAGPDGPPSRAERVRARRALGLRAGDRLVLGVGYADLRKGFDLFTAAFRLLDRPDGTLHFGWVGAIDPAVAAYGTRELAAARATGRFHAPGFVDDPSAFYAAADVLALPSREDPYPSVMLEALTAGLPVVAFDGSGGAPDLVTALDGGAVVPPGDVAGFAAALARLARCPPRRATLANRAAALPTVADYAHALLRLAAPALAECSVAVPSWNYARYMPERMRSVFAQTHPVREVLLLDDASDDDSVALAETAAAAAGRSIVVHRRARNGGSPIRQWAEAARLARGEWLWIAEADDAADPAFLATLLPRLAATEGAVLGFTDSRTVDAEGAALEPSYRDYYRASGCTLLERDGVLEGVALLGSGLAERNLILNASAVVFRTAALRAALGRDNGALARLRVAADWQLYATLLAAPGARAVFVAQPLNVHRRHAASATHALAPARHRREIATVQDAIAALVPVDRRRQLAYRRSVLREARALPSDLPAS